MSSQTGRRLLISSAGFLAPSLVAGQVASEVDVRVPVGVAFGQLAWGPPERIRFRIDPGEAVNGFDDDGDRLVDEGTLEFVRDPDQPSEVVTATIPFVAALAEGEAPNGIDDDGNGVVDDPGVAFTWDGRAILYRVTSVGVDGEGRSIRASVESAVTPRNSD